MNSEVIDLAFCFAGEEKAIRVIESIRWPGGPVCLHCGHDKAWFLGQDFQGRDSRHKAHRCPSCRKKFSVVVGAILENPHILLNKWLAAIFLMRSSEKGVSANQHERSLGITCKSAWFSTHQIRRAMDDSGANEMLGGIVEDG